MYALRLGFGVGWLGVAWSAACGCSAVGLTPGVAATPGVSAAGCCLLFFCFVLFCEFVCWLCVVWIPACAGMTEEGCGGDVARLGGS